jgi:NADH dehydrogenase FAD-containing subunit
LGVHLEEHVTADRIVEGAVLLDDGVRVEFDACLVALSFEAPELARTSGLLVDAVGRLLVDETLRCPGAMGVVGAGDAVVAPDAVGAHLRMSCAGGAPPGRARG